ncbi:MAG: hypothetical protein KBT03_09560 [Bacteroidales bacterium]|nr:hypothetical protein [Candidatus Scybalousia scybalohippi]
MVKQIEVSVGKKYGHLTILKDCGMLKHKTKNVHMVFCRCDCGVEKNVNLYNLTHGNIKSCGCIIKKTTGDVHRTHGFSGTRLYRIWQNIKKRCYDEKNCRYNRYGGRGIKMCDEWRNDFKCFYDWSIQNGYDWNAKYGDCTIDRIDNDGNYEPSNCRWVSIFVQNRNRGNKRIVSLNGEEMCLANACDILKIDKKKAYYNIVKMKRNYFNLTLVR